MPRINLVIGANRGIGLGLVEELVQKHSTDVIYATARVPAEAKELQEIAKKSAGRVIVVQLDMVDQASIDAAVAEITKSTEALDEVIVNGGAALGVSAIEDLSAEDFSRNLDINVVGPHRAIKAFVPFLKRSKSPRRVLAITSSAGGSLGFADQIWDMTKAATGQDFSPVAGYFATKTAVNGLIRQWGLRLEGDGIPVVAIHPGLVDTDMAKGMPGAIPIAQSAAGFIAVIAELDPAKIKEGILSYDGSIVPW